MQSLPLIRLIAIASRPRRNVVPHLGIIQSDVFHVRRIEAHVRMFERERHIGIVERRGRVARLEREPFEHVEDLGDLAADGRGAHLAGADGEEDADAVGEVGGAVADELGLRLVPEDVDGVVGDEGAVEELVRDAAVRDGHGVEEGEGGGGGEGGFAERHLVHPLALRLEGAGVVGEDGGVARALVGCYDKAGGWSGLVAIDGAKGSTCTLQNTAP